MPIFKTALIIHNLRSCHNVGSLLRTADGLGIDKVYLTGYTPYPQQHNDTRLPHLAAKLSRQISKTALGAENSVNWRRQSDIFETIKDLRDKKYTIVALEQTPKSQDLATFSPSRNMALIVGREVEGIESAVLDVVDSVVQIPMLGSKESLNVSVAAAIALYHLRSNTSKLKSHGQRAP